MFSFWGGECKVDGAVGWMGMKLATAHHVKRLPLEVDER